MKSKFENVSQWGAKWLGKSPWQSHTVDAPAADKLVTGYVRFLQKIAKVNFDSLATSGNAIDIGCGAGFITNAFRHRGLNISGTEYDASTVAFARSMQPAIDFQEADLSKFSEKNMYAFIFTREVYLFTRVNDFERQRQVLSNLIDSLHPGGILLLVASEQGKPDCLDFSRAIGTFRKDSRIKMVTGRYLEPVFKYFSRFIFGKNSYHFLLLLLAPYIAIRKFQKKWAPSLLITFEKKR